MLKECLEVWEGLHLGSLCKVSDRPRTGIIELEFAGIHAEIQVVRIGGLINAGGPF